MANKKLNATITIGGAVASSLKGAFGTVKKSVDQVGQAMANLERQNKLLANSIQTFGRQGKNVDSLRAKYASNVTAVDKLRKATERLKRVEEARERNLAKREQYKDGILGTIALGATVAAPIKAAMNFESTMADIKKVVDAPKGQDEDTFFKAIGKQILDMSKILPMTADEIGRIFAAGGQSGVATEDLAKFTESAVKMGVAFDISAEQAGQAMAEMRAAFGMTQDQVNTLADQMNYLDNNGAAAAKDIMEIVQRIGPLAKVAGVSASQVAALGSTLRGMGVQNEIAATGIKNLFLTLSAGKSATKAQREVFKQLGYTSTEVAKSMQLDARKTMTVILKQIGKLRPDQQAAAMSQLFGKEVVGSIAPLLTNLDKLNEAFDMVGDKSKYAGSMEKEFTARAATTANQMILFRNQITGLGITIGSVLLPAVNSVLKTVGPWIGKVTDLAEAHPVVTKAIVATAGALITMKIATFAAGFAFTFLRGGALRVVGALAGARAQMALTTVASRVMGGAAVTARGGLVGLATRAIPMVITAVRTLGLALVTNPIGLILTGIALAGVQIYRHWDGVKAFLTGTLAGVSEGLEPLTRRFKELWNNLGPVKDAFSVVGDAIGTARDWLNKLLDPVKYTSDELKGAGEAGKTFGHALAEGIKFVYTPLMYLIDKLNWVLTNIDTIKNKAIDFKNSVSDTVGGAWDKTKNFFSNPFGDEANQANTAAGRAGPALGMVPPPTPAMASRSGSTYTDSSNTTIQINQRAGESSGDLAKRITDEQERRRQVRERNMMNDGVATP